MPGYIWGLMAERLLEALRVVLAHDAGISLGAELSGLATRL